MHVERKDDIRILTLEIDHLDSGNYTAFKSDFEELAGDAKRVVMDIQSLKFVDSAGLGSILSVLRALGERGGSLKIAGVTRPVEQLFTLVRLPRIIDMYPTVHDAVRAYQQ